MNVIQYQKDDNNIVHMIFDRPNASANLMDEQCQVDLQEFVARLEADDNVAGIIVRSAKETFFAGGDLTALSKAKKNEAKSIFESVEACKQSLRKLETLGKPVVACINGAALGGGWEIALACHYRVSLDQGVILGLPEVTLGLLPGAGGVVRMVRRLGLQGALPFLVEGRQFKPEKGLKLGLIDEIVSSQEEMLSKACDYIQANPSVEQIYDVKGYKVPGGKPSHPAMAKILPIAPAILKQQTKGVLPAPEAIMCVAVEGLQVDFDTACRIESRYFVELVTGQVSKNMINTLWFQLNEIKSGQGRPKSITNKTFTKIGILGAGMMGSGIAYSAAINGIEVVLKDTNLANAEKGKAYSDALLSKKVSRGRMTEEAKAEILNRITATDNAQDLSGCELVVEAVFEDPELKASVTQETLPHLPCDAVFASNTSTLPITGLAQASAHPQQFIGLHFFSPVDKMPLVEIICGDQTDDKTLAQAYDFVLQIAKTPIIVNDHRSFFTSRVIGTFTQEAVAMLGEGVHPSSIENAAFLAGYPVGPLAIVDEISISLSAKIRHQTIAGMAAEGKTYIEHPADKITDSMLEQNRLGKSTGAGFYDYPEGGEKHLWSGLNQFYNAAAQIPLEDIKDRFMYIEALESARCYEESVLTNVRDANIGSIMGIGYPVWSGGVLQFINQTGVREFVTRSNELAQRYGDRFLPPASLLTMAENNETYSDANSNS